MIESDEFQSDLAAIEGLETAFQPTNGNQDPDSSDNEMHDDEVESVFSLQIYC